MIESLRLFPAVLLMTQLPLGAANLNHGCPSYVLAAVTHLAHFNTWPSMMKDLGPILSACPSLTASFPSDLSSMSMAGTWFLCLGVAGLVSFVDLLICLQLQAIPKLISWPIWSLRF